MWDHSVRTAAIAALLAVAVAVGANALADAALILPLWILLAVLLIVVVVSSNRARYRITTHPETRKGLIPALILLVSGAVAMVAMGGAVWTVVRAAPGAQAPLGLGEFQSVARLRWGYQRLGAIVDTGWQRPAKDAGTCWVAEKPDAERRRADRVEVGGTAIDCSAKHRFEVLGVFAYDQQADSTYPGVKNMIERSVQRCQAVRATLTDVRPAPTVAVEYPTQTGWENGDHDVSCVAVGDRDEALVP